METVYVYFSTVMDVKRFVESISPLEGELDLIDGRYVVDARSLMGIFGMNLTKPIQLRIHKDSKKAIQAVKRFIVDEPVGQVEPAAPDVPPAAQMPQMPRVAPSAQAPRVILEETV